MKLLVYIGTFVLFFALSGVVKAQQAVAPAQQVPAPVHGVAVPAKPYLNIHRTRRQIMRQHYKELSHELRMEIHRDRRELKHLRNKLKHHHHHARKPLSEIRR